MIKAPCGSFCIALLTP
ncbi:hypothetical protein OH457_23795 [Vibrio sp. 2art]|nr:hypothetical protein [Vibrio sp. 2art]MDA0116265.1 hypothetical protein [Vibrio sp. 2art]